MQHPNGHKIIQAKRKMLLVVWFRMFQPLGLLYFFHLQIHCLVCSFK